MPIEEHGFIEKLSEVDLPYAPKSETFQWYLRDRGKTIAQVEIVNRTITLIGKISEFRYQVVTIKWPDEKHFPLRATLEDWDSFWLG